MVPGSHDKLLHDRSNDGGRVSWSYLNNINIRILKYRMPVKELDEGVCELLHIPKSNELAYYAVSHQIKSHHIESHTSALHQ